MDTNDESTSPRQVALTEGLGAWLPIATAPEDMTEPVVVRWVNSDGEEAREFDYKEDGFWVGWSDHAEHVQMIGGWGVSEKPPYEHWLPLPAAPQNAQSA